MIKIFTRIFNIFLLFVNLIAAGLFVADKNVAGVLFSLYIVTVLLILEYLELNNNLKKRINLRDSLIDCLKKKIDLQDVTIDHLKGKLDSYKKD